MFHVAVRARTKIERLGSTRDCFQLDRRKFSNEQFKEEMSCFNGYERTFPSFRVLLICPLLDSLLVGCHLRDTQGSGGFLKSRRSSNIEIIQFYESNEKSVSSYIILWFQAIGNFSHSERKNVNYWIITTYFTWKSKKYI